MNPRPVLFFLALAVSLLVADPAVLAQPPKLQTADNSGTSADEKRVEELRKEARFADAAKLVKEIIVRETDRSGAESERVKELNQLRDELVTLQKCVERVAELKQKQEFEEAESYASRVLALELAHYGVDDPQVAECRAWRESILRAYRQQRDSWSKIEARIEQGYRERKQEDVVGWTVALLRFKRRNLGDDHTEVAKTLLKLAAREEEDGRAETAITRYEEAIKTLMAVLGPDHWRVAAAKMNYRTALQLSRVSRDRQLRLIQIERRARDIYSANSISQFSSSIPTLQSDLEFIRKQIGSENRIYLQNQVTLGEAYRVRGKLADADHTLRQITETIAQVAGKTHPMYCAALARWAIVRSELADFNAAVEYSKQGVQIAEQAFNPLSNEYLVQLQVLSRLLYNAGLQEESLRAIEKLTRLHLEERGRNHPLTGVILSDLAHGYLDDHQFGRAKSTAEEAYRSIVRTYGPEDPRCLGVLNLLARLEDGAGETEAARQHFEELVVLARKNYQQDHVKLAEFLGGAAFHFHMHGDLERAVELLDEVIGVQRNDLDANFEAQSERNQLERQDATRGTLYAYLTCCLELGTRESQIYERLWRWKGAVSRQQFIASSVRPDSQSRKLRAELERTATAISSLIYDSARDRAHAVDQEELQRHWRRLGDLEQQLATRAKTSAPQTQSVVDSVKLHVPAGVVLIDFYHYNHLIPFRAEHLLDFRREPRLLAFVIRPDEPVRMVQLGSAQEFRKLNESWRKRLQAGQGGSPEDLSAQSSLPQVQLRKRLWEPLEQYLNKTDQLLICPDGPINEMPLAALPGKEPGHYLIEDFSMVILPSTQWLVENDQVSGTLTLKNPSMFLVGDVDFGDGTRSGPVAARMANAHFSPLPGTAEEVETVADLFRAEFANGRLTLAEKQSATESMMRKEAPRHQFVHFATHGFFVLENPGLFEEESFTDRETTLVAYLEKYLPEVLSGIALAGANIAGTQNQVQNARDDGILTALELSVLDLKNVEIAVLSACETALGQEQTGEGMLGLQRALQVAGAKTTVTSLWKVDDKATQVLMTEFYTNLWQKRLSRIEALRQAQIAVLDRYDPREQKLRPRGLSVIKPEQSQTQRLSPYYWAPFLLSGEWR